MGIENVRGSYFPSGPELQSLSRGPQGALGFCALHSHGCASMLGSPVTQQPAADQRKGGDRRGEPDEPLQGV